MAVSEEERCLEVGFLAGIEGRELAPVLASMCEPYEKGIHDLNTRIAEGKDDPKRSQERFGRLQGLVDEEASLLSSLLQRFQETSISTDGLRESADGEWMLAAIVGVVLPSVVAGLQHDDLSNASRWLLVVMVAIAARWGSSQFLPSIVFVKLSEASVTFGAIVALEVIGALMVTKAASAALTIVLGATACLAGLALAIRAHRRAMREPVLSDLRRAVQRARDRGHRIENERQRNIDSFLRTEEALQSQVHVLLSEKQKAQRRVTEGYLLGQGLAASRYRVQGSMHGKAN